MFATDDDDDDEEDEDTDGEEDDGFTDILGDGDDSTVESPLTPVDQTDMAHESEPQNFPRMARLRCNLTAMSQRYNVRVSLTDEPGRS